MNNDFFLESEFESSNGLCRECGAQHEANDEFEMVNHPRLGYGRRVSGGGEMEMEAGARMVNHPRLGYGRSIPAGSSEFEYADSGELEIIGSDGRKIVKNTIPVAHRWICCLDLYFPDPDSPSDSLLFRGTGLLISPCHVLTCGHCLYDEIDGSITGKKAKYNVRKIVVTPGRNGALAKPAPFGSTTSVANVASKEWSASMDWQYDFGLITLKDALGAKKFPVIGNTQLGCWGSTSNTSREPLTTVTAGTTVYSAGYPGDKCRDQPPVGSATKAQIAACSVADMASTQWFALGKVIDPSPASAPRLITYDIDTYGGQSGSPVWARSGDRRHIVAIHTGGYSSGVSNRGVRFTKAVWDQVKAWMQASGSKCKLPSTSSHELSVLDEILGEMMESDN